MADIVTLPAGGQVTVTAGADAADALQSQIQYYDQKYDGNAGQVAPGQDGDSSRTFDYSISTVTGGNAIAAGSGVTGLFDNGTGHDTLTGSAATLLITANNSGDAIYSEDQSIADTTIVVGGTGNDTLYAQNLFNLAYLGGGANQVFMAGGTLTLNGPGGSDTVNAGDGNDYIQSDYAVTVVLSGSPTTQNSLRLADGSTIVGGAGSSGSLYIYGDHQTLTEAGTGVGITMTGSGAVATISGGNDTIQAYSGAVSVEFTGTGPVDLGLGDHSTITGSAGSSGIIAVGGSSQTIIEAGSHSEVDVAGLDQTVSLSGSNDTVLGGDTTDSGSGLSAKVIVSAGGDDTLTLAGPSTIVGGAGSSGTLTINGNDLTVSEAASGITINLNSDNDTITLAGKNESLLGGRAESVSISGGGNQTITLSNSTIQASAANATLNISGNNEALTETGSGDSIGLGAANGDTVNFIGGKETVTGTGRVELNITQGGNDTLKLGPKSTITGSAASSGTLSVGGNDQIVNESGTGVVIALGSASGDTITLSGANDNVTGKSASRVSVSGSNETLSLGAKSTVFGSAASKGTLTVSGNNDSIGESGSGIRIGLGAATGDTISLVGSKDVVTGTGPARVSLSAGNDTVSLGAKSTISASAATTGSLIVNGNDQTIQVAGSGVNLGLGSAVGDTVSVSGKNDTVSSTKAERIGLSGTGNETLKLGAHSTIVGAAASTGKLVVTGTNQAITESGSHLALNAAGSSNDTITFGAGAKQDMLTLGGGANVVTGGQSATVMGGSGSFTFHGRADGHDSVIAGRGAATLVGGANGTDIFRATLGDAVFRHAAGGNDTFVGGSGSDTMFGAGSAAGKDLFVFESSQGDGLHTIESFTRGHDHIQLSFYDTTTALAHQVDSTKTNSVVLNLSDGTKIDILGISHLVASDFVKPNTFG